MGNARSQSWHRKHNATHYLGTRQMCVRCGAPTDRCEEDMLYTDDSPDDPLCEECYDKIGGGDE